MLDSGELVERYTAEARWRAKHHALEMFEHRADTHLLYPAR